MKIIFSPTKTQNFAQVERFEYQKSVPFFQNDANFILEKLKQLDKVELKKLYKVSDKITEELFEAYKIKKPQLKPAIFTYKGITFQSLELNEWSDEDFVSANERLVILDALYGALKPADCIEKYRLDMSHSKVLAEGTLKAYWKEKLESFFVEDHFILNLSSDEFSSLIPQGKLINFAFLDEKDGVFRAANTYVKMARGKFTGAIIRKKIQTIEELKNLTVDGYYFYSYDLETNLLTYRRDEI